MPESKRSVKSILSHGVWNDMAYVLFGFGSRQGSLGIGNTAVFGPENGLLGLGCNLLFAWLLWRLLEKRAEFSANGLYQVRRSG